jgi:hypothetical protein
MTPVELALAVVWGVLFAVFTYERWKTPRTAHERRRQLLGPVGRMNIRIIKHKVVPDCGSYEVRFVKQLGLGVGGVAISQA